MKFYISESFFAITFLIASLVTREFIISRNGILRKIMITYFATVVYTYAFACLYYASVHYGHELMDRSVYVVLVSAPKAGVMIWLLWYLWRGRVKK